MASLMANILPSNATAYERQLAKQVDEILALDVEKIRHLWNPWTCDIALLPYLAWALSVDIWDASWPDDKKRLVVASAIKHHRLKGTQKGIETYLDLIDCKANYFVTPPARGFRIPSVSKERWLEYLANGPQIRIRPFLTRRIDTTTGFRRPADEFRDSGFREPTQGPKLYGRHATYFANGVEHDVVIDQVNDLAGQSFERIRIAGPTTADFHKVSFRTHGFRSTTEAESDVITLRIDPDSQQTAVTPGVKPQSVQATHIAQRHTPPTYQHFHDYNKSFRGDNFRSETDANQFVYDRVNLFGRDTMPTPVETKWYRGDKRYGIPKFTAHINVSVPIKRSNARGFGGRFRNGFRIPTDMSRLDDACAAVVAAKSLRDDIYIDTVTHRVVTLRDGLKLGSFRLGEIVRIA